MASTGNPRMVQHTGDAPGVGLPRHTGAESGAVVKAKLVRNVKETAAAAPYQSAYTIVKHLLQESRPIPNQRSTDYLGRIANYHRQQSRPCHPQDLGFELDMCHWPDQFEDPVDITVGNKRHVLFFSKQQLTLLSQAKRWYADGTFKVVRAPFTQLWSIHAFVCVEDQTKQLPLAFAIMSGKRRRGYLAVLWALKQELRRRDLSWNLECVTMDFEAAAWAAFRAAFPEVDVRGCSFHWGQAVWRHMQEQGMQHAYQNDPAFHSYCRQLLALPYLPWEKIDGNLAELEGEATTEGQRRLCTYIHQTWIESAVWPPSNWSCFYRSIRTNNKVEGWHRRLNSKASSAGNLNLYLMLQLLAEESRLVTRGCQLLKESTIIRRQRADARSTNAKLFRIWDSLVTRERTARQVLRAVSHLVPF
ncbi:hypothetical protein ACOMHN_040278 [Nucella lapillus]